MDPRLLTPIPTPPAQRWREVRLLYLPRLLFAAGLFLIIWLWSSAIAPSAMVAEAEIYSGEVRSMLPGVLTSLNAVVNQKVRTGEVLGQVMAANPRVLEATLDVIRAEVAMLVASDNKRVAVEYERLQLDWISQRVERAAMMGRIQQVEADLARLEPLHKTGVVSDDTVAQLKLARESLQAQAQERSKIIEVLEGGVREAGGPAALAPAKAGESALAAAIKVQDAKIKLAEAQLTPLPLVAPIDGVVTMVLRRAGESLIAGEPVVTVIAPKPIRLTGYLRQPLPFMPKAGMTAEIRTRGTNRKTAATTVTHVGTALEIISPTLLAAMRLPTIPPPETALRVEFKLPTDLQLTPGEHVDVYLR